MPYGPAARSTAAIFLLAAIAAACTEEPLVVFMDSAHPARIYDEETRDAGRTNADLLAEYLGDLPIRGVSEATSPAWRRDAAIAALEPDLIVIHYSAFREEDGTGPRERLRDFLAHFGDSGTEFVIYSRTRGPVLDEVLGELLVQTSAEHPSLLSRIRAFGLDDHGERSWLDPPTVEALRETVVEVLGL